MKRFKNSSDPEPKQSFKWKLKAGITWDMVELVEQTTDEQMMIYFDKVEVEIVD